MVIYLLLLKLDMQVNGESYRELHIRFATVFRYLGTENAVNQTLTKIAQTSIDYCNNLKQDHSAFINYMRQEANDYNINNVLIALDEYNDSFKDTKYFREKKAKIISKLKKKMMLGKLLLEGG